MTATTPLEKYLAAHPGTPRPRPRRRLTFEQVARIRAPLARGGVTALAREFGISKVAGWKVKHRISYRDLP
jgi:hypothetical protein